MKTEILLFIIIFVSFTSSQNYSQKINFDKYIGVIPTNSTVRIASASVITDKWEKETNWLRIEKMVKRAALEGGADVVITPEGALDGYVINEVNEKLNSENYEEIVERFFNLGEPLDGAYIKKASALSNDLNIYLVLGFLEREKKLLYNTAILIDPDGDIIGKYRKSHFAQGYTINPKFYTAGDDYPLFQTTFGKVGILICYDRQLPEPARILALKGADILFVPSYGGYSDQNGWNTILLQTRARENHFPLVFCHPYQSLLITKHGDISAIGTAGNISYYELKLTLNENKAKNNRRPEIYKELIKIDN